MATDRSLRVSEIFTSFQGEGPSAGAPATFLRLAVCNLRCSYCDTRYTWDFTAYSYRDEVRRLPAEEVLRLLLAETPARLVVTGGEPLLQQRALAPVLAALPPDLPVEVETNGTLAPLPELAARVDQWNVSPKLSASGDPERRRLVPRALEALLGTGRAWLKLVVDSAADSEEATALVARLAWPRERVLFMPRAATRDALHEALPRVTSLARGAGFGLSPRLHVEQFDGRRGV
ncbi:MAG: 7-carboxy-7-deazaguanine synthase QueE [Deltaproteobacteria bacterium]|nr:7-carboxy-7-deazaguanine synthase QueE [Deltaproteobacteria bacterium]